MSEETPSSWNLLTDDLHADCRIFEIRKQRFLRNSDRKEGDFFVLNTNDWVNGYNASKHLLEKCPVPDRESTFAMNGT